MGRQSSEEVREMSKYLFIGSHPDDIELSCGGTICKLKEQGHEIQIIALSFKYHEVLSNEFEQAAKFLGVEGIIGSYDVRCFSTQAPAIADNILNDIECFEPDYVFTHDEADKHDDHWITAREVKRVWSGNLITFLHPWNGNPNPNYFVEITEEQLSLKIELLKIYYSQSGRSYMSGEFIRSQSVFHGAQIGRKFAEAFKIQRLLG